MNTYISSYNTTAEYNAVKSSLDIPHVAETKDDETVHYLPASNIIIYKANAKLPEVTSSTASGVRISAFSDANLNQLTLLEHIFDNGTGILVFNGDIIRIGTNAFKLADMARISIPNTVTIIGPTAFQNCNLTSIEIPDSVTTIYDSAFRGSTELTSVILGRGITNLLGYAFRNCPLLTRIACKATTAPSIRNTTFSGVGNNGVLYVPTGSDYSTWMQNANYYLGLYGWTITEI